MKKTRSVALLLVFAMVALVFLSGCGGGGDKPQGDAQDPAKLDTPDFLTVVSSTPGGAWYPINVAHNEKIEELVSGLSIRLSPGGSTANVKAVGAKEADIGICHNAIAGQGYIGVPPFDKKYEDVRHLLTGGPAAVFYATLKNSKIKSIADMKDKRIGFAPQGYLSNTITEQLFEVAGFTLEDIKKNGGSYGYYGLQEGPGMLVDGQIDVYLGVGPWPATVLQEIDFKPGINLINIDDELAEKFLKEYPYYSTMTVPKGTYQSVDYDVQTVGSYWCLIANASMSDDMAYLATKAFWDNLDDIKSRAVDAHGASLEKALNAVTIPIHPGAQKYYDEQGVKKQ